jgi:Flp pilus assembly pilin Flp
MGLRYYTTSRNIRSKSLACRHIQSRSLRGQTLAEYALIVAFISVVAIGTLMSMGGQVTTVFSTTKTQLGTAELGGQTAATHH